MVAMLDTAATSTKMKMFVFIGEQREDIRICSVIIISGGSLNRWMPASTEDDLNNGFFNEILVGDISKMELIQRLLELYGGEAHSTL